MTKKDVRPSPVDIIRCVANDLGTELKEDKYNQNVEIRIAERDACLHQIDFNVRMGMSLKDAVNTLRERWAVKK